VTPKVISFRTQLKGTLSDFLAKVGMQCPHTEEGLLELVVALSHYTEEGNSLFPQVILCDDLDTTLRLLQCTDPIKIGCGLRNKKTMIQALKRCAPLARNGWVAYLQRFADRIDYGVFRVPYSPTALDIRDTVKALIGEDNIPPIILAIQLADKAVELLGTNSGILNIYLSATPDDAPSPRDALDRLVATCCTAVSSDKREQVQSFLRSTLSDAMRYCHGTLVAVIAASKEAKDITSDGVIFSSPISIPEIIEQHEQQRNDQSHAALTAYGNLLAGMLNSDGIVVVDTQCRLIGYNLFIRTSVSDACPQDQPEGGARHRAYHILCHSVDQGQLQACFIRSSDGGATFHER